MLAYYIIFSDFTYLTIYAFILSY